MNSAFLLPLLLTLNEVKIHKTIGVYPDLSWKRNAVDEADLEAHIKYNKEWRWGRALIIDGICVYNGGLSDDKIQKFISEILPKIDAGWNPKYSSAPYH